MIYIIPTDTCYGIACPIDSSKNYDKIYEIKKRSYDKPLALMVEDIKRLEKNTSLNKDQIDFLKNYKRPFTILTDSNNFKIWLNYEDEETKFINKDKYKLVAFRVAHNPIQKKLIKEIGPIFLTSANLSDKPALYKEEDIKKEFLFYIEKKQIKLLSGGDLDEKNLPSDIFEFIGDSTEIKYLRKL